MGAVDRRPDTPDPGGESWREPLVRVRGVAKVYRAANGGLVRAVAGVDLDIAEGEAHALVGESGSGKTTLARCILRLIEPSEGTIEVAGQDVGSLGRSDLRHLRRQMQLVFQDPVGSLDPRMSVRDLVAEPIRTHLRPARGSIETTVLGLLDAVGLGRTHLDRRPHELSGGQCQRVAIARALAVRPRLVVLDEPTSSLDVSVQAQILNLLGDLRASHGLTYLLISHDLGVVRHLCDRISVMYLGRIVEHGATEALFADPLHPYTRALLSAVPDVDGGVPGPALIRGDPPSPAAPPAGCRFHPRCWLRERLGNPEACERDEPVALRGAATRAAACHFVDRRGEAATAIPPEGSPS